MLENILKTAVTTWHTLRTHALAHKIIATIIGIAALYGVYYMYGVFTAPSTATRYVTTTVATGTVVATMSETGQVSASSNITLQSKSSGEVLSLLVTAGQHVSAGTAIATIDPTTAEQNVRSAEQALQSARISLETLQQNLSQSQNNGYTDVAAAFLNLSSVISGLDTVLHGNTVAGHAYEQNIHAYSNLTGSTASIEQSRLMTENAYQAANASYTQALADFKATPRTADAATIGTLINETYQAVQNLSDALRASTNFLDSVHTVLVTQNIPIPTELTNNSNTLMGYTTTTTNYVTVLANDAAAVGSTGHTLAELQTGVDPLDIQSSKLSVQMKEDALAQAKQALADTVVRAPMNGTVAAIAVQRYQTIGSGTAVATMVSDNQSVNISVNEVDASKLKVGQKATITLDALPDLSIAGTVSSVNTIGTVSSGVVSYAATITFDTANSDVKAGMSATANIVTGIATGIVVPSSAIKTTGGRSSVLIFDPPLAGSDTSAGATSMTAPTQINVTTGLSDDASIIITSGITAGEQVVTKTIAGTTATTATAAAQSTSLFGGARGGVGGIGGGAGAAGGAVRVLTH